MKTIILAGGLGTRILEETVDKPKPMVLIDGKPILFHIMNIYASQGFKDFLIATGYKSEIIHNWIEFEKKGLLSNFNVNAVETGLNTQTGGRLKICLEELDGETSFATYGDGLGNININELLQLHRTSGRLATVTAVRPPARFGYIQSRNGLATKFGEKNQADTGWINGGFFVLDSTVSKRIVGLLDSFEEHTLPKLVTDQELGVYHHEGFWQPMDTLREKNQLEHFAKFSTPPWLKL